MINGRLDYCNSVPYGTLAANLNKLQRVELRRANRNKDQMFRQRNSHYCRPTLSWLTVKYRIQYKVAVTVYKILTTEEPSYVTDVIRFHVPSRHLRSCNRNLSQKDRTNLVFTDRSFSQAPPAVWNNLPQHVISDLFNLTSFNRLLKTELYNRA